MGAIDRVLQGVKEVLHMSEELKRLSEGLKGLAIEVREIDKRLVRIETIADIAKLQAIEQNKQFPHDK